MKIKPKMRIVNPNSFIHDYLTSCGIENPSRYIHAGIADLQPAASYINIDVACYRLRHAIENRERVMVLVD